MTAKAATIQDVATHAGVSRAAVSKVIRNAYGVSEEMRSRVQASIEALSYRPRAAARAMRGSSYTIGIEVPTTVNAFLNDVIAGASNALAGTPYRTMIAPAGPRSHGPEALQVLADRQVDGIVAVSSAVPPDWLDNLARNIPLVMLGRSDNAKRYDTIMSDDTIGTQLALDHLYELGHRDIAHITIDEASYAGFSTAPHARRVTAYCAWMERHGLSPRVLRAKPTEQGAHEATRQLLNDAPPTAIFAGHDELALGVLSAAAALGLPPSQLSVVGYDDTRIAAHPLISLTSIQQSADEIGELAMRLLLERIDGRQEPVHILRTPSLSRRNSTQAPRH